MFRHFSLSSYFHVDNANVLKHILVNNIEQNKLSFVVQSL